MGKDNYIFSNGRLKRKDNNIYFDNGTDAPRALQIEQVDRIHIYGEVDLNTKLLNYLAQYGLMINVYNYYGYYSGTYYPRKKNVSGFTIVNQSMHYYFYDKRLYIAKCFIDSAVHHILRNLRRHKQNTDKFIEGIEVERRNVISAESIQELMGAEGRIRKIYYESFNIILRGDFEFTKREKRPPTTPINALMSFGNSLMYTTVLGEIYKTQLEPTISFLHEPSTKRFSLSLDISEIFKPLIIDSIIFSLINNNRLTTKDFDIEEGICFLNDTGKKKFVREYENKLNTTIKHRTLKRKVSYKMLIRLECYKLIKHFVGDQEYKPLKAWW
ncbi:type I-B CRISPR-associated endonuclease Cas1b [Clostridium botulinum]|uniref:type I-B CRISPR-associated endonuclease Cas1b n=1 Tax=Clostridium botulinum TaxID=1491 RepID=UPI0004D3F95F|nr:type I-B CRISPR-associated endonuclease Cas1b [Clostridium botulinum]KEH96446.1 CRISPR-associated protein Cas1 [Clostridium botulinum D str. 16868]MCD3276691.1 type I-B CRISPR-associated endonuclease Cas1 [Clostridium botulinum C/D]MCD3288284.1 type I-B CRISPR-associated endonuclease Cas1 [Clostridium botulinum C/D]MCD3290799.1 type I-B CRISPR-associated endonuclease Cas1 [Clostridium botulinum C/D]MCD3303783.1 type I-B CRISPR-associated endonuclease Cas1 [Clostridium botulinum C/D]